MRFSQYLGGGSSLGNIFGFYKTRHILLSDSVNFTELCAVVLCSRFDVVPACGRQTDGQTDGIAIASTALAMLALRALYNKTGLRRKAITTCDNVNYCLAPTHTNSLYW